MNKELYSYHIFVFPFKWEYHRKGKDYMPLEEKNKVSNFISVLEGNKKWERVERINPANKRLNDIEKVELYNEKNYFYDFVHPAMYDTGKEEAHTQNLVYHYELKLVPHTNYRITKNNKTYILNIKSISLNVYTTGVGILAIDLQNVENSQKNEEAILAINQYGRRLYPPYLQTDKKNARLLADIIEIDGLVKENFSTYNNQKQDWALPLLLQKILGKSFYPGHKVDERENGIYITPVIDDRMFTMCWFGDTSAAKKAAKSPETDNFWAQYVWVDTASDDSWKYDVFAKKKMEEHTYKRWKDMPTLYGITRYSFMILSDREGFAKNILSIHFRTMYYKLVELCLVQRASVLQFSDEVTAISHLSEKRHNTTFIANEIKELYRDYIRFINKIYFREITAQEQGIDLYDMLQEKMRITNQVADLDGEIEELHSYASGLSALKQGDKLNLLTIIGFFIGIPSFFMTYYSTVGCMPTFINVFAMFLIALLSVGAVYIKPKAVKILLTLAAILSLCLLLTITHPKNKWGKPFDYSFCCDTITKK